MVKLADHIFQLPYHLIMIMIITRIDHICLCFGSWSDQAGFFIRVRRVSICFFKFQVEPYYHRLTIHTIQIGRRGLLLEPYTIRAFLLHSDVLVIFKDDSKSRIIKFAELY